MKKPALILLVVFSMVAVSSLANAYTLYNNNFNSGNIDDWTVMSAFGIWSIESGILQVDTRGVGASQIKLDTVVLPGSFVLEFDVKTILDGGGYSLVAFYTHWMESPEVSVSALSHHCRPGRFIINETLNGVWVFDQLFEVGATIDPFVWQHAKLVKDDLNVSFEYGGQLIYDVTLPESITGGYLMLAGASNGIHQFDNLKIKAPVPEPATMLLLASGLVGLAAFRRRFN